MAVNSSPPRNQRESAAVLFRPASRFHLGAEFHLRLIRPEDPGRDIACPPGYLSNSSRIEESPRRSSIFRRSTVCMGNVTHRGYLAHGLSFGAPPQGRPQSSKGTNSPKDMFQRDGLSRPALSDIPDTHFSVIRASRSCHRSLLILQIHPFFKGGGIDRAPAPPPGRQLTSTTSPLRGE